MRISPWILDSRFLSGVAGVWSGGVDELLVVPKFPIPHTNHVVAPGSSALLTFSHFRFLLRAVIGGCELRGVPCRSPDSWAAAIAARLP